MLSGLFSRYKCPECGKPMKESQSICECGFRLKQIACAKCMNTPAVYGRKVREELLAGDNHSYQGCSCGIPYIELDISQLDYYIVYSKHQSAYDYSFHDKISYNIYSFWRDYAMFPLGKYMYDRYFDHEQIDPSTPNAEKFFAFLDPHADKSNAFFLHLYGDTYDDLLAIISSDELLKKAVAEKKAKDAAKIAAANVPTCPICHSTNLSRISVGTRAVKTAVFGIYGAMDDAGKTWKCNKCGAKF